METNAASIYAHFRNKYLQRNVIISISEKIAKVIVSIWGNNYTVIAIGGKKIDTRLVFYNYLVSFAQIEKKRI